MNEDTPGQMLPRQPVEAVSADNPSSHGCMPSYQSTSLGLDACFVCFSFDEALQGAVLHPPRDDHRIEGGVWLDPQSYKRQNVIVLDVCPGEHFAIESLLKH
jgi:hypothetical protein